MQTLARTPAPMQILIVGDGPERTSVEECARHLGVEARVHLAGHRSDPAPLYAALDLYLIASDTEQMPMALLEAMASGLPVVSLDVGDVRHVLPAAQAEFVPAQGPDAPARLAAALTRLASDPELARRLGQGNRAHVAQHYALDRMVASYRACYEGALS